MSMKTLVVALAMLLVAGCGNASQDPKAREEHTCSKGGTALAQVRLAGAAVPVRFAPQGGDCNNALYAEDGTKTYLLDLGDVVLSPEGAVAVTVPGRDGQVLAAREVHPRGGYQWHLYGVADGRLAEILADGKPPIPFVATDTQPQPPMTIACKDPGLQVTQARAHEPAGVMFTWDLDRIDITISGNDAKVDGPKEIEDNVVPSIMARKHLDLVKQRMFVGCE